MCILVVVVIIIIIIVAILKCPVHVKLAASAWCEIVPSRHSMCIVVVVVVIAVAIIFFSAPASTKLAG